MDYPVEDLSLTTAGGPLVMERFCSSAATSAHTSPLGYGWAHNQDTRLLFSGMSGGESSDYKLLDILPLEKTKCLALSRIPA